MNLLSQIKDRELRVSASGMLGDYFNAAVEAKLLSDIIDKLSTQIADEIYPEILKAIDKELIVKEVALRVSDKVISKLFSSQEDSRG